MSRETNPRCRRSRPSQPQSRRSRFLPPEPFRSPSHRGFSPQGALSPQRDFSLQAAPLSPQSRLHEGGA